MVSMVEKNSPARDLATDRFARTEVTCHDPLSLEYAKRTGSALAHPCECGRAAFMWVCVCVGDTAARQLASALSPHVR